MTYHVKISSRISILYIFIVIQIINLNLNPTISLNLRERNGSIDVPKLDLSYHASNEKATGKPSRHIVIATIESAPFVMRKMSSYGERNESTEWYGYCIDFFEELIKHLPYDVTYEIYQVADNKFGSKTKEIVLDSNQSEDSKKNFSVYRKIERWNGLVGDLQQGKAHLALAPMAVMAERELVIDFTVPFYDLVGIQILLRKPEVPQDWFKFLTVLDGEVWLSITVAYFVTSFVIFLFDRLSPYSHKNLSRIEKIKHSRLAQADDETRSVKNRTTTISSIDVNLKNISNKDQVSNIKDGTTNSNESHLTRSHHLFIGSLANPVRQMRRRSSAFVRAVNSSLLKKDREVNGWSNFLAVDASAESRLKKPRESHTLSDYIRGIEFRDSVGTSSLDANSDFEDGRPDFSLKDSLWFCITSLTPQGGGEAPQNLSGRIVAGAWWLFCFIIIASYTANLAAFLTVSRLDIPIESLDDLAKQYRIRYAPVDGTAEQTYFERMAYIEEIFYNIWKDMSLNDSLSEEERSKFAVWDYPISDKYTKIWAQIQQVGMPPDSASGIQRVKDSNLEDGFALLADANMVRHAVNTDCSFKAVGDEFSRKPIALGVQKGDDQFRDDLSQAILQLINRRFMEVLREKWWTNNPERVVCDNNDESEGISVQNIGGVFIIIFSGVILSFIAWAIERFVYRTKIKVSRGLIKST